MKNSNVITMRDKYDSNKPMWLSDMVREYDDFFGITNTNALVKTTPRGTADTYKSYFWKERKIMQKTVKVELNGFRYDMSEVNRLLNDKWQIVSCSPGENDSLEYVLSTELPWEDADDSIH